MKAEIIELRQWKLDHPQHNAYTHGLLLWAAWVKVWFPWLA